MRARLEHFIFTYGWSARWIGIHLRIDLTTWWTSQFGFAFNGRDLRRTVSNAYRYPGDGKNDPFRIELLNGCRMIYRAERFQHSFNSLSSSRSQGSLE